MDRTGAAFEEAQEAIIHTSSQKPLITSSSIRLTTPSDIVSMPRDGHKLS
jgi:hypothetical protein